MTIRVPMLSRGIYSLLWRLCPLYRPAPPWDRQFIDENVRSTPVDAAATLQSLRERFPPDSLVVSGVAEVTVDGEIMPAKSLLQSGAPLVFLRPRSKETPVDVLSSAGCLSGRHLPVIAVLSDFRNRETLQAWHNDLLVAAGLQDAVLFRSLGFAATMTTGLYDFDRRQLGMLARHFGWTRSAWQDDVRRDVQDDGNLKSSESADGSGTSPAGGTGPPPPDATTDKRPMPEFCHAESEDQDGDPRNYPSLLLAGWSPSRLVLEEPAEFTAIAGRFRDVRDHLRMQGVELGVWRPRPAYLERLSFQLRFDPTAVSAAEMYAEIDERSFDLMFDSAPAHPPNPGPANFLEAQQRLRQALRAYARRGGDHEQLSRAFVDYEQRLEQEVIQPLYRASASPHKRNLQALLMHVSRLLHRLGPSMDEELAQIHPMDLLRSAEPIPRGKLQALSALVRDVIALCKGLRA